MEEKTAAIESILVIPRNQFYWTYRVNEGSEHTIKKEKIFNFLKEHVTEKNYIKLSNLLSKFLPFIILVKENSIVELKKQKIDSYFYRQKIEKEISDVITQFSTRDTHENSLENKLTSIQKKVLKD
jgi:uncharacterized membrane-anchored protein YitT (DUF2179 family)